MNAMKRAPIIVTFIFVFLSALIFRMPQKVSAASTPYMFQTPKEYDEVLSRSAQTKELNKEAGDATSNSNNINYVNLQIGGSGNPASVFYYKKSALAQLSNAMAFMYQSPPANTYAFVQDFGQSLGFIPKKAYAAAGQGSGYQGLLPLLPIWKAFRNIAYGLLAVAMIVVGFMVMFRRKIDPKTVMTVQNSLPRIVVTLLLITFSYAIVGFLIDLMYVFILMGIEILSKSGMQGMNASILQAQYLNGGILALFIGIMNPLWNVSYTPINASASVSGIFLDVIGRIILSLTFLDEAIGLLFRLLISLAFLFIFIRILFTLFSCYIQILMDLIIGPLQLLLDVFPGSTQTTNWFKHLLGNLAAFPLTIFLLILGDAISRSFGAGAMWEPPLLNISFEMGGVGIGSLGQVAYLGQVLVWLGILFSIPTIINSFKAMLKTKGGGGGGAGALGMVATTGQQLVQYGVQKHYYDQQLAMARESSEAQKRAIETAAKVAK